MTRRAPGSGSGVPLPDLDDYATGLGLLIANGSRQFSTAF
jgi:hypothetical protein